MNLIEENFQNKKKTNKKTSLRIILIAIIILVILIISITGYLLYIQSTSMKLILDGQSNEEVKNLLIFEEDGTIYAPIKKIASYLGYESYNGEYSEKSEENSKCYIQNENEVTNFYLGDNKIYKLDLTNPTENYEYIYTNKPIKAINGILYASSDTIEKAFNVSFKYDKDKNKINIYTMPYLIEAYSNKVLDYGYSSISEVFANQKTILKNMLVVEKGESITKKGVIDVNGNVILEAKYDNITYLPNGDFLVENNKKVGIISSNRETKVQIMYDSINLMDNDAQLYLAKKDDKYGVIDFKGNIKIYIENDEIGMDISNFEQNNIKNKYILAGNLIPVRKDKYWALYDKKGHQLVDFKYDSLGYIATDNKDALSLLVIPDYNVLVACKDQKYTLLNSEGKELIVAPVTDAIYMTINEGEKHYTIETSEGIIDAKKYLDNIKDKITEQNKQKNNVNMKSEDVDKKERTDKTNTAQEKNNTEKIENNE